MSLLKKLIEIIFTHHLRTTATKPGRYTITEILLILGYIIMLLIELLTMYIERCDEVAMTALCKTFI